MQQALSPSKLCPYCDEPLPLNPSSTIKKLLKSLLNNSRLAPRPSNSGGRDAPLHLSITLCSVHRAESSTIPAGLAQGWPDDIDFEEIGERMAEPKFKGRLRAILLGENPDRGHFWGEACRHVKAHGLRAANSLQGQMETFEAIQPG